MCVSVCVCVCVWGGGGGGDKKRFTSLTNTLVGIKSCVKYFLVKARHWSLLVSQKARAASRPNHSQQNQKNQ